jgi:hypothetical protein
LRVRRQRNAARVVERAVPQHLHLRRHVRLAVLVRARPDPGAELPHPGRTRAIS